MKKLLLTCIAVACSLVAVAEELLIEAESFSQRGGWVLDQQFMDQMGSPYLMAHGMGIPVADATAEINIPQAGTYYVYARTYNWTSPWTDAEGPGKFRLALGGKLLKTTLGHTGNSWQWQSAGKVVLKAGTITLALKDLTGFNGRCDAIYLTTDMNAQPTAWGEAETAALRARLQQQQTVPTHQYDFVVVGGGVAGMCAATAAARLGCRVALVNDRPVLGGNNSSEIRVHLGGIIEKGPNEGLGRMIREFGHERSGNAQPGDYYEDQKKEDFIAAEKNITLYASQRAVAVKMQGDRIASVTIQHIETGEQTELTAPLFSDCTGDATIGYLAGADWTMGREGRDEYGESLAPEQPDSLVMGASVQWYSKDMKKKTSFPRFEYGMRFGADNCEPVTMGEWKWETGMNRNQITEAERIRDYGLLVVYSNWSYLKNHYADRKKYANRSLDWVAYVSGKRESRRLLGDYVLAQDDIDKNVAHEDASFTTTWSIDLHFPDSVNSVRFPDNEFKSATVHRWIHPYAVPYRCLYSRNVDNLFMAGRNMSCTHVALGTVRVMRTTGMMGEVVGMAAGLCHKHGVEPRDIYHHHLPELKQLMQAGLGKHNVPDNQRFNEPNKLLEAPAYIKPQTNYE